jgi:hypothetical protein
MKRYSRLSRRSYTSQEKERELDARNAWADTLPMNALIESLEPLSVLQEMRSTATSVGDMATTLIAVFSMLE